MIKKDDIDIIISTTQKTVNEFTYPIFTETNKRPDLIASSVLIKMEQKYYLITASHVIDNLFLE